MQTRLEVEGLRELRRGLKALDAGLGKKLNEVGKKVTGRVVERSKPDIPVRTGRLRASARGTADAAVLGGAKVTYTEFVYWKAHNRWYHREAEQLIRSGVLAELYDDGLADLAREAGLEVER